MTGDDDATPGRPSLRVLEGGASSRGPEAAFRAEREALAAFLVGDDDAFGDLVRRNERLVLSVVRRYARTSEDARDLAQRTFLRAFVAARRAFRRGERAEVPFRRWLVRIAVNLSRNHLRDTGRWTFAPLEAARAAAAGEAPGEALARAEAAARMRRAVLALPRRQREVLGLRIDAELPFAEIAAALGITENAAKVTFHHAMRRLREALAGEDRT
jgi:RNA polymerase sigma-70 factor (ECF subfamily)